MISKGVCGECPKYDDRTEKELSECPYCKRFFCVVHASARLVFIKDYFIPPEIEKTIWYRTLEVELQKEGGHPCFKFTSDFWRDFDAKQNLFYSMPRVRSYVGEEKHVGNKVSLWQRLKNYLR